jgi:hypothetical protein
MPVQVQERGPGRERPKEQDDARELAHGDGTLSVRPPAVECRTVVEDAWGASLPHLRELRPAAGNEAPTLLRSLGTALLHRVQQLLAFERGTVVDDFIGPARDPRRTNR